MFEIIKMKNKKGISPIIASVLIIMLTVVLAGILFAFVIPLVQDMLDEQGICLDMGDYVEVDSACYNSTASPNYTEVFVRRGGEDISLEDIRITIRGEDEQKSYALKNHNDEDWIKNPGQGRKYTFENITGKSIPEVLAIHESGVSCDMQGISSIPEC